VAKVDKKYFFEQLRETRFICNQKIKAMVS